MHAFSDSSEIEWKGLDNTVGELDLQTCSATSAASAAKLCANLALVHADSDAVPSALLAALSKLITTRSVAMPAAKETAAVIFDLTVSVILS